MHNSGHRSKSDREELVGHARQRVVREKEASSLLIAHAAHTLRRGIVSTQGMMRWETGGERGT